MKDVLAGNHYEIPLVNLSIVSSRVNSLREVRIDGWDNELWNIAQLSSDGDLIDIMY